MYYTRRIFFVAALFVLAIAAMYSIRLALADAAFRKQTPQSVARALELLPDHASYLLFRAQQMDYDGEDSTALLERIASVNPLSSTPRIRLGLAAEARGNLSGAEKWLLDAAQVDRQFEPRWTLANFYFRRERPDEFWKWIRAALEVSYGDRSLAFDLCWRMSQNADEVLAKAIPDRHEVVASYLYYVMDRRREATASAAFKLAQFHDPSDSMELETACDVLMSDESLQKPANCGCKRDTRRTVDREHDLSTEPTAARLIGVRHGPRGRLCCAARRTEFNSQGSNLRPSMTASVRRVAAGQDVFAPLGSSNTGIRGTPVASSGLSAQPESRLKLGP